MAIDRLPPFAWQGKDGKWGTRGENSRITKLTEDDVRAIKRAVRGSSPPSDTELGASYGVSRWVIGNIRTGRRWGHVKIEDES